MGAGASAGILQAVTSASEEDLREMLSKLPAADVDKLKASLSNDSSMPQEPRLLLVSDGLPLHEKIINSATDNVTIVPVQYNNWSLEDLKKNIEVRAGPANRQFASVGLLDHGAPGEFRLLASVGGGSIDLGDFASGGGVDIIEFFRWLAQYVRPPKELHAWQTDLTARIDLMACSVAKDDGIKLITFLEEATKVNWAASIDKTGAGQEVENNFDWDMETEANLGCIAKCYFDIGKIAKWQNHAGVWAIGGAIGGFLVGGPGGATAGYALGGAYEYGS